jgi:hypothetical protein
MSPMMVPATTGPAPKMSVRVVREALTAAASFFSGLAELVVEVAQAGEELGGELGTG